MSESMIVIETSGRPCPEPVVMVKQASGDPAVQSIVVTVDNQAASDNILRFASYAGWSVKSVQADEPRYTMTLARDDVRTRPGEAKGQKPDARLGQDAALSRKAPAPATPAQAPATKADSGQAAGCTSVFLASDALGSGNDELGQLLMRGFLFSLKELEAPPENLILMNGGVRLACAESRCIDHLRQLEAKGTRILVCGTCLEFFGLKATLAVGSISNMRELTYVLAGGAVLRM